MAVFPALPLVLPDMCSPVVSSTVPILVERQGRIIEVGSTLIKAHLPWAKLGEVCTILPEGLMAEVVAIQHDGVMLSLFSEAVGLSKGQWVRTEGDEYRIPLSDQLLGRMVDGLGRVTDGAPFEPKCYRSLHAMPPEPMNRQLISQPMPLGVRALDAMLTCGVGQRVGIFAAPGGGKSTLLGMLCAGAEADVIVLALVGERGREVREFTDTVLSAEARKKCVLVVATSERPALERLKASYTATTIAEYFRDMGLNVLLMVDSLTRYARAAREVGLASGEPPVAGGYPPSVFANLPRIVERAGPADSGSITAIYTILVEGDNMNEPVADEVRSLLDGHIILSRKLAERNHYPAIDITASVSRVMHLVTSEEHRQLSGKLRRIMSLYKDIELLVRVGEYQPGNDPEADEALLRWPGIKNFLCQPTDALCDYRTTLMQLQKIISGPC